MNASKHRIVSFLEASGIAARNVILGSSLSAWRLWLNPRCLVGYSSESLFLYRAYTGSHGLPQKNVFEVLPSDNVVSVQFGNLQPGGVALDHWFNPLSSYTADLANLCLLARILKPKIVFEIGTLKGYTTLHFALNTEPDARIYSLDLPPESGAPSLRTTVVDDWHIDTHRGVRRYCFDGTPVAGKITTLFGDSAQFDYGPYRGRVDLFFIDGAHSYEYVRADTAKALACCHPGSVVAWHDFGRFGVNGVSRWLREFAATREVYCIPGGSLAFMVVK